LVRASSDGECDTHEDSIDGHEGGERRSALRRERDGGGVSVTGPEDRQPAQTLTGRVLIVDDDPTVGLMLSEVLSIMGYSVKHAATGEDALDDVMTFEPDAVLLDLVLPGMTGGEVLDVLRQRHPHVRVVIITGNREQLTGVLGRGAVAYLTKPFSVQSVQETLRVALGRKARNG
jgi:CheY-like chemotaxis protein